MNISVRLTDIYVLEWYHKVKFKACNFDVHYRDASKAEKKKI